VAISDNRKRIGRTSQFNMNQTPLPKDRLGRDVQHLRRLLHTQSTEKAEFDHLTLALIEGLQTFEGLV
jgi:hypothetical protein